MRECLAGAKAWRGPCLAFRANQRASTLSPRTCCLVFGVVARSRLQTARVLHLCARQHLAMLPGGGQNAQGNDLRWCLFCPSIAAGFSEKARPRAFVRLVHAKNISLFVASGQGQQCDCTLFSYSRIRRVSTTRKRVYYAVLDRE